MTPLQAELQKLAELYPRPVSKELDTKYDWPIRRMANFYRDKATVAEGNQVYMFHNFELALIYAEKMIKDHRELCQKLDELAYGPQP